MAKTNSKIQKGDLILWEKEKYSVEDVRPDPDNKEQNIYTVCRMESPDGVSLKLNCLKIKAKEGELEKIKQS